MDNKHEEDPWIPHSEMKPLCPLDVPPIVWQAVAQEYTSNWLPAPNYHVEYRDCRNTFRATSRLYAEMIKDYVQDLEEEATS